MSALALSNTSSWKDYSGIEFLMFDSTNLAFIKLKSGQSTNPQNIKLESTGFPSYGNQHRNKPNKKSAYLPQLVVEEILLKLSPHVQNSLGLQSVQQDPPRFHPEPLYDLLNLHMTLKLS